MTRLLIRYFGIQGRRHKVRTALIIDSMVVSGL